VDNHVDDTVESLLAAAGLTVSDEDLAGLVRVYPDLRAQADALNGAEFQREPPAPVFDPSRVWARPASTGHSE
jgi:hypothetical protein